MKWIEKPEILETGDGSGDCSVKCTRCNDLCSSNNCKCNAVKLGW
ncbi:MAG: hypothetical protein PHQ23_10990 [Candidatus Wallbacteria bacterium]|nr:hypothetical protein [Candidatus Wallbacteria bacterium]